MKRGSFALCAALSLMWVACVRTDGFAPLSIQAPLLAQESPPVSSEIQQILSQPFRYLGKGRQCFVFESADGRAVLKFFNQKYLQVPWYAFLIKGEKDKRALRRFFYEHSYEIAYRELKDEILYLHLGPSEALPLVSIADKTGRKHVLDLNHLPFVLQRKGVPFYTGLSIVYQKEGIEGLYREIDTFLATIQFRIAKNIADADRDVEHNWGYVDGHIFHLDPGRLYYDDLSDPTRQKEEWDRATHGLCKWLSAHYPEAAKYLRNQSAANFATMSNLPGSSKR